MQISVLFDIFSQSVAFPHSIQMKLANRKHRASGLQRQRASLSACLRMDGASVAFAVLGFGQLRGIWLRLWASASGDAAQSVSMLIFLFFSPLIPAVRWALLQVWLYRRGRRGFKHLHRPQRRRQDCEDVVAAAYAMAMHGPAAEALLEGAENGDEWEEAAGSSDTAAAAGMRPPRTVDWAAAGAAEDSGGRSSGNGPRAAARRGSVVSWSWWACVCV